MAKLQGVNCMKLPLPLPLLQDVVVLSVLLPSIDDSEYALAPRRRSI